MAGSLGTDVVDVVGKVTAYEVGYRAQPATSVAFTITGLYNEYDDLCTIELDPVTGFLPLRWGNRMKGDTYGVELNARFGWRWTESLELAVSGADLLQRRHVEYAAPAGEAIGRSVFAEERWSR